jgi:hypothetical protein
MKLHPREISRHVDLSSFSTSKSVVIYLKVTLYRFSQISFFLDLGNAQELEVLKTRLQHEFKEVSDVFKGELDEVNGKLATSDRMLSHMQRYMGKIDAELQVSCTEFILLSPHRLWRVSIVHPCVLV